MKTITNLVTLTILTVLLGCGHAANRDEKTPAKNDSVPRNETKNELTNNKSRWQMIEAGTMDSVCFAEALNDAFKVAQTAFQKKPFGKQYEFRPAVDCHEIKIEILVGKLFDDNQTYFLLRRHGVAETYLNLYKVMGNKTQELIERKQDEMTYIGDTIADVNGDGSKDFLVHWYPSSGCCRRNVYNVYLNQPHKGRFTPDYQFINPTFSAKEKVIRGVEYGHPGEVGLYKYKWNGLQVDTLEFIHPDVSVKGQFIKTKTRTYRPTANEGIVLKAVPKEYHTIESYEWFIDF